MGENVERPRIYERNAVVFSSENKAASTAKGPIKKYWKFESCSGLRHFFNIKTIEKCRTPIPGYGVPVRRHAD